MKNNLIYYIMNIERYWYYFSSKTNTYTISLNWSNKVPIYHETKYNNSNIIFSKFFEEKKDNHSVKYKLI